MHIPYTPGYAGRLPNCDLARAENGAMGKVYLLQFQVRNLAMQSGA